MGERLVKSLSGGQRRRVDLAASLVTQPSLLVLDEPTKGLDPRSRQVLWAIIHDLDAQGVTLLLTTQTSVRFDQGSGKGLIPKVLPGRKYANGGAVWHLAVVR